MRAWMNRTALEETPRSGRACYWSRSRRHCGARMREAALPNGYSPPIWTVTAIPCYSRSLSKAGLPYGFVTESNQTQPATRWCSDIRRG